MKYVFVVLVAWGFLSCSTDQRTSGSDAEGTDSAANEALYLEVMRIHDEVMPKTGELYLLKTKLKESIADSTSIPDSVRANITSMIADLDSADQAMMVWMRGFELPDTRDQEARRAYLESQMEEILRVRDLTEETILRARDRLEKK